MARVQLRIYVDPGGVEVFCNFKRTDGSFELFTAMVDTGAQTSLFPISFLETANYRPTTQGTVTIDQAGLARQSFDAIEAYVTIMFEDTAGNYTTPVEVRAWFADTNQALIGFSDVLEHGILHIDMPKQNAWLEFPD